MRATREWTEQEYAETMHELRQAQQSVTKAIAGRNWHTKENADKAIRLHEQVMALGFVVEQLPEAKREGWAVYGSSRFE